MTEEKKQKTFAEIEKETIIEALERYSYNIGDVADALKVTRYFLYSKIEEYQIKRPDSFDVVN